MDIILFLSKFFYRIRYWLLWGSIIVTGLVIYFTQFLPYKYTVNSSLYAGVTSNTNSMTSDGLSIFSINSTFDNLINIAKSKGTLEKYQHAYSQHAMFMVMKIKTPSIYLHAIIVH